MRAHARWSFLFLVPWAMAACDLVNDPGDLVDANASDAHAGDVSPSGDGPSDGGGTEAGTEGGGAQFCSGPLVPATSPASGRWCDTLSPQPLFCSDFDIANAPTLMGQGWDSVHMLDGGSITLSTTGANTPPNAAFVQIDLPAAMLAQSAYVQRSFSIAGFTEACLEFDMEADSYTPSTQVASINATSGGMLVYSVSLVFAVTGGTAAGVEWESANDMGFDQFPSATMVPTSKWTRIRFHWTSGADGGSPEVDFADTMQVETMLTRPAIGPVDGITIQVGGDYVASNSQPATLHATFDDVTFDMR